eukprot:7984255-Pyramimonas_sp.AAC.1
MVQECVRNGPELVPTWCCSGSDTARGGSGSQVLHAWPRDGYIMVPAWPRGCSRATCGNGAEVGSAPR